MFLCLITSAKLQKRRRITASLCDYLFTNYENGTGNKENVTQNKEISPPKRWKYHYFMPHLMLFEYELQKIERQ